MVMRLWKQTLELAGYVTVSVALWGVDWRLGLVAAGLFTWQYGVTK